jgi:hypothetical protein
MTTVRPWSEKIWFSPKYVIEQLTNAVIQKKNLKRYKEAWICAVAVICFYEKKPIEWWIQVPHNDPPDVLAMNLVVGEGIVGQALSLVKVEVFEISSFDDEYVGESIARKLDKKDYSQTTLIAFVRRKGGFDHLALADYVKKLSPNIQTLSLIVFEEQSTNVSFIQLFPECVKWKADFGLFCKTTVQRDFIELSRGVKIKKEDSTTTDVLTLVP